MATEYEDDEDGPPTQPSPSPDLQLDRAIADLVTHLRAVAGELHELRVTFRKMGITPQVRAALGGALRRARAQMTFTINVVDPPPARRPAARSYKARRA